MSEMDLREHARMKLTAFYLDDITKLAILTKLRELGISAEKGALSATIRVLLKDFANSNNPERDAKLIQDIQAEYTFTTKKNKRSTL